MRKHSPKNTLATSLSSLRELVLLSVLSTSLLTWGCDETMSGTGGIPAGADQGSRRLAKVDALIVPESPLIGSDEGLSGLRDGGTEHSDMNTSTGCEIDRIRCGPSGERQRCAYNPDTRRAEWSSEGFCSVGEACLDGQCQSGNGSPCEDICSAGSARCSGPLIQFCATGAEGCMLWMQPIECEANGTCVDGACQSDGCRNTCFQGQIQCVGDQARRCEQNADGCWSGAFRNNVKTGTLRTWKLCLNEWLSF